MCEPWPCRRLVGPKWVYKGLIMGAWHPIDHCMMNTQELIAASPRSTTDFENLETRDGGGEPRDSRWRGRKNRRLWTRPRTCVRSTWSCSVQRGRICSSLSQHSAVVVVEKRHHGASCLQVLRSHLMSVSAMMLCQMRKYASWWQGSSISMEQSVLVVIVRISHAGIWATLAFRQFCVLQLGRICDSLKQMREMFDASIG